MPFLEFNEFRFWEAYDHAVNKMLDSDADIIRGNPTLSDREKEFQLNGLEMSRMQFESLLDREKFEELRGKGEFRLSIVDSDSYSDSDPDPDPDANANAQCASKFAIVIN